MDPFKPYQPKPKKPTVEDAQTVALRAMAFIAGDDDLLADFASMSGCGADDLRRRLAEPAFLGAVLDFILADEATTVAFAKHEAFAPETTALARMLLP